ncbi:MAG TPA: ABC transporter permease [Mycobacteriales bacterium]|nr:ABC transporter permease [Mycobacteriales bacterium]
MVRYIIRRLIGVVAILVVISIVTFGIFFIIPANPAIRACGKGCTQVRLHEIEAKLGIDKPVFLAWPPTDSQYGQFAKGIFTGRDFYGGGSSDRCDRPCLGFSFATDQQVWPLLKERVPVTFSIAIGAALLWLIVGVSIGILSALRKGTIFDRGAMSFALAGVSLPSYFTALLALNLAVFKFQLVDYPQYSPFHDNPAAWAKNLMLPWITLAFLFAALYARLTRANMLETMGEDYIRTARAKGLPESKVIAKHGLRAALTPIVTIFGLDLGGLLGGAILTESVYGFPGLGKLALDSITKDDFPVILGVTLFAAFFIVMANLIVDIVYAFVDPKVQYS